MLRTKVRLKAKSAPTRHGARAQWAGAHDFKRHVGVVSPPGRDQSPDLLRRLEREVAPLADTLTTAEPSTVLTRAEPRSILLRAFLRTAIGGMAMAALVIAWQHMPSDARDTETTGARISKAEEVARLGTALVEPEVEHRQPQVWHEDSNLLLYRSPWPPR